MLTYITSLLDLQPMLDKLSFLWPHDYLDFSDASLFYGVHHKKSEEAMASPLGFNEGWDEANTINIR